MLELEEKLSYILEHPIISMTAGAATAGAGLINKVSEIMPAIHDILSDGAIAAGLIVCIIGGCVQWRNYKIRTLDEDIRRIERDKIVSDFIRWKNDHNL